MEFILNLLVLNLSKLSSEEVNCDKVHEIIAEAFKKLVQHSRDHQYGYRDEFKLSHTLSDYRYSAGMALGRHFEKALLDWHGDKEVSSVVAVTVVSDFLWEFPDTFFWGQEILFSLGLVEEKIESNKLPPGNYRHIRWYHLLPEEKRPAWVNAYNAKLAKRPKGQLKADK